MWKANVNGVEVDLRLNPPDQAGLITGQMLNADFRGFWEESAQRITFSLTVIFEGSAPVIAVFTGFVFRTPTIPEPGRDVTVTVTGYFQMTPSSTNLSFPAIGTARRHMFGWYAQFVEVN
jgi:hypothetical protein